MGQCFMKENKVYGISSVNGLVCWLPFTHPLSFYLIIYRSPQMTIPCSSTCRSSQSPGIVIIFLRFSYFIVESWVSSVSRIVSFSGLCSYRSFRHCGRVVYFFPKPSSFFICIGIQGYWWDPAPLFFSPYSLSLVLIIGGLASYFPHSRALSVLLYFPSHVFCYCVTIHRCIVFSMNQFYVPVFHHHRHLLLVIFTLRPTIASLVSFDNVHAMISPLPCC